MRATAHPARMRKRHWAVLLSFVAMVLLPLMIFGIYLWGVAEDRYASTVGFIVRQEEGQSGSELLGGLSALTGGTSSVDGDVLYEFIRSQDLVRRIDERLQLRDYYSGFWRTDPIFALWPDATIEDMLWYWGRVVRVSYNQATGLTELRIQAFDPQMAQAIAVEVVGESQAVVNALNEQARADAIRYADLELTEAENRLRSARAALTEFRIRTQIVDLEADIQARMGVVSNLQQRLATELVAFDELSTTTNRDDPRVSQAERRIQVIRDRISDERRTFATTEVLGTGEDYPTLMSEFEGLSVERAFAEEAFRAALAARDAARADAVRQSRYLATYVSPTLAESAEFPQRFVLLALAALFSCLVWSISVLVYYSIRDKA
ncbi:MAG: sugar transporter [Pseudomonadota bacterium]